MASKKPRVLITHWVHASVLRFLKEHFDVVENTTRETWSRERVAALARDCDAMMAFMPDTVNEAFLAECPRLRVIAASLKGPDNFDIAACTRHNVWFTLVPDLLTIPTAELAIALLLGITRRVLEGDDHIRSVRFRGWRPELYGAGITGRTLGLIGMGAVGQAIAERLAAFDVRCLYTDPNVARLPDRIDALQVDLETLLAASHFVMPLAHLTPATYHLIGARALGQMRKGAFVVNVGRGSLVDEAAVAESLAAGHSPAMQPTCSRWKTGLSNRGLATYTLFCSRTARARCSLRISAPPSTMCARRLQWTRRATLPRRSKAAGRTGQ